MISLIDCLSHPTNEEKPTFLLFVFWFLFLLPFIDWRVLEYVWVDPFLGLTEKTLVLGGLFRRFLSKDFLSAQIVFFLFPTSKLLLYLHLHLLDHLLPPSPPHLPGPLMASSPPGTLTGNSLSIKLCCPVFVSGQQQRLTILLMRQQRTRRSKRIASIDTGYQRGRSLEDVRLQSPPYRGQGRTQQQAVACKRRT